MDYDFSHDGVDGVLNREEYECFVFLISDEFDREVLPL
jgi:hypothetical protein